MTIARQWHQRALEEPLRFSEFHAYCATVIAVFEEEAMNVARKECAARNGERAWFIPAEEWGD